MQLCEADGLITESCQNFLMPQQAPAVRFNQQHCFASTPTGYAGRMLNGYRLIGQDRWKPKVETCSSAKSALDLHGSVVFLDNLANRCESETVTIAARRKKRFEDSFQRCPVHAAPGIGNRYDREATGADPNMPHAQRGCYFPHRNLNLDDTRFVHRLCSVVADIQDDLLQWRGFRRYNREFCRLAYRDSDMGR